MKANINTVLVGEKVVLVPYRARHVPTYHKWMLSEELRSLTASEPLSLEEEYEMQRKWQFDEDKLTFIILARESSELPTEAGQLMPEDPRLENLPMVGDVNIFLYGTHPGGSAISQNESDENENYAEVEIMIAEPSFRRKGLAIEAVQLMLSYVTGRPDSFYYISSEPARLDSRSIPDSPLMIRPQDLVTRISSINLASISLFEKLGFQITKRVEVFDEVEMRFRRSEKAGFEDIGRV